MGVAIYFWLKHLYVVVKEGETAVSRVLNFFIAVMFLAAILGISFYWWDTLETQNTFFSKPIPNLIEL